jgi:PAS domain S-box-containing protein
VELSRDLQLSKLSLASSEPQIIVRYAVAVLSTSGALIIARWLDTNLVTAPVSLFLCAIMFSAWFGGVRPGLLSVALSVLAFDYYFVTPIHSLAIRIVEIPRFIIFVLSAFFVGLLSAAQRSATETLRGARDSLSETVQELTKVNSALQAEIAERQRAEDARRRSESYLSEAQRLSHTGSFGWRVSTNEIIWSEETFRIFQYDPGTTPTLELILRRLHPEDRELVEKTFQNSSRKRLDVDFEHRLLMPDGSVKHVHVLAHAVPDSSGDVEYVGAVMDISARRRAEEELRESEEKYRDLFELSPDAIYVRDKDGTLVSTNSAGLKLLGCSWEEAVGMATSESYLPEELADFRERLDKINAGSSVRFERTFVRKDGSHVPVEVMSSSLHHGYSQVVIRDISEQRQARAELERALTEIRKSEDRLRRIIDTIPTMAWSTEPDGSAEFLNRGWLEFTGRTGNEARGWGWKNVIHPEDSKALIDKWRASIATGNPFEAEARFRLADGQYRWCLCRGVPLRDDGGKIIQWYGVNTDIEDVKRAEALLAGEKRLLEMIAKGHSLNLTLDALCRLVEDLSSDSMASILLLDSDGNRLRHGAAPSLPGSYTEAIDGAVIGPFEGSCGTAAYRKEPVIVSDIATDPLWADYRDIALVHGLRACWSTPILSSDGRVLGTFAIYYSAPLSPNRQQHNIIEQVTHLASIAIERKQAEDALKKAQAEVAHVARVMTMGELVASIAHEVNQPLGAIVTNGHACVRLLSREAPDLDRSLEVIGRMIKDGMRASEVIKRIRELMHKSPAEKAPLNLNETIQEMIGLVSDDLLRSKIELKIEFEAELPPVLGDRIQLQQVILNLILNAKEAMSGVQMKTRELQITTRKSNSGEIAVAVQDSGPGLDPKDADQIFEAFYTTKPAGIGMGLAISRSIVEAHGGTLWATTNDDKGATFQFTLPAGNHHD